MKARQHALIGGVAASALIPVLGINSLIFLTASVLIDGDHYTEYIYRNRFTDFNIKKMFRFTAMLDTESINYCYLPFSFLHTIEALILLFIGGQVTNIPWIQAIFWGMLFHIICDLAHIRYHGGNLFRRSLSIFEYIIKWNIIKRRGNQPEKIYGIVLAKLEVNPRS
ncbi:hypothetical protein ACFLVZ_01705 [Chloroflexota bacterium]